MINRTELNIEERLIREVADLRREVEALKAPQLLGSDNLNIILGGSSGVLNFSITLAAGEYYSWNYGWTSGSYTGDWIAEPVLNFYIGTDGDHDYLWPSGASLSAEDKKLMFGQTLDGIRTGAKFYDNFIYNNGSSSKTIYVKIKVLYVSWK